MKKAISIKNIFDQLKADLIGKDSYRGVTLTYTWLANQFGHFSLGFIPALFVYSILLKLNTKNPSIKAALYISILWLLFELYNFLAPLILKNISRSNLFFIKGKKKYKFIPAWGNIAFDTFTDLSFFWLGAFSTCFFISQSKFSLIIIFILILILFFPIYYWYCTKIFLQNANYPFQFRLSQWDLNINEKDIKAVYHFLRKGDEGNHIFIFGSRKSGKTSLSIGIATEFSINHKTSIYLTAMKFFSLCSEIDFGLRSTKELWTWRDTSLLIIDDINPGSPVKDIINPEKFFELLTASSKIAKSNIEIIKNKNVIWVLGDYSALSINNWFDMLEKIGVSKSKINSINLQQY